jgi:arsenate reductase
MAEGFLKALDGELEVYSAGVRPETEVSKGALKVMPEIGIDITDQQPDNVSKYLDMPFDYVITVCDHAKETCPVFTGKVEERLHIGFEDPAHARGTEEEVLNVFRKVRDEIREDFTKFYNESIKAG